MVLRMIENHNPPPPPPLYVLTTPGSENEKTVQRAPGQGRRTDLGKEIKLSSKNVHLAENSLPTSVTWEKVRSSWMVFVLHGERITFTMNELCTTTTTGDSYNGSGSCPLGKLAFDQSRNDWRDGSPLPVFRTSCTH